MLRWIRSFLFLGTVMFLSVVYASAVLLVFWGPPAWHWAIIDNYCRVALRLGDLFCGLKVIVEGQENLPNTASVIMIKHTTALETYGHIPFFPRTAWVLKRELLWVPVIGWALSLVIHPIAINRGTGTSAVKQVIRQGAERLAAGNWVTIFPEGTRVPPGETRKYGISGAALARAAGVKIVPVAHNAGDFWRRREFVKRPGLIRFCIGPPIDASAQSPKETSLIVQNWIETKMLEISSEYQAKENAD